MLELKSLWESTGIKVRAGLILLVLIVVVMGYMFVASLIRENNSTETETATDEAQQSVPVLPIETPQPTKPVYVAVVSDKIVDAIWEPLNDSLISDIMDGKLRGMVYVSSVAEIVLAEIKQQNNVPVSVSIQNHDGLPIGKFAWSLLNDYEFLTALNSELINRFQKSHGKVSGEKIVELAKFFLLASRNREEVAYEDLWEQSENPMVDFILRKWGKFHGGIDYEGFTVNEDIYSFAFVWIAVGGGTIPTEWVNKCYINNIAFRRIIRSSSEDIPTPNPSEYGIALNTPLPTQTPQLKDDATSTPVPETPDVGCGSQKSEDTAPTPAKTKAKVPSFL